MSKRRALFLDRDGTINIDKHYVYRTQDFEWVPGIVELCRAAQSAGYDIVVVTNQSGIERGYFTEADYAAFTRYMCAQFAAQGVQLLDVLHCPYLQHPNRKPAPGLFLLAAERWGIDMAASASLGDKPRDVQAGIAAGVGRNYLLAPAGTPCESADAVVDSPQNLIPLL
ncbi:MAG: HAD family hydrolase [Akkermansiaceae bacterium]|nr:HAD family hydrolase [Akkermansiaceae bacterium]